MNWEQGKAIEANVDGGLIETPNGQNVSYDFHAIIGTAPEQFNNVCFVRSAPGSNMALHVIIAGRTCDSAEVAWQLNSAFHQALGDTPLESSVEFEVQRLAIERAKRIERKLPSGLEPSLKVLRGRILLAEAAMRLMAIEIMEDVENRAIEVEDLRGVLRRQRPSLPRAKKY